MEDGGMAETLPEEREDQRRAVRRQHLGDGEGGLPDCRGALAQSRPNTRREHQRQQGRGLVAGHAGEVT